MLLRTVRAVWGAILLLAPRALLERIGRPSPGVIRAARLLGARQLAVVVILSRRSRQAPPRWPGIVDVVHGASMLALAASSRRVRREAIASAGAAGLLASWTEIERWRARARGETA